MMVHGMEKAKNHIWLKTNDKKTISIMEQEGCYSSYINVLNNLHLTGHSKKSPININIKKKDVQFFQTILHKPTHYGNNEIFSEKKYFKALTIAEKFQAPILYAELLEARLPEQTISLITQKYICLHNIRYVINCAINTKEYSLLKYALEPPIGALQYDKLIDEFLARAENLKEQLNTLIKTATLTQAVLLTIINNKKENCIPIKIIPHMPGYHAFAPFTEEQINFILDYLPITLTLIPTKTGLKGISSFNFNV